MKSNFEKSIDNYLKIVKADILKEKILRRRLQRLIDGKINHIDYNNTRIILHPFQDNKFLMIKDLDEFKNPVIIPPFSPMMDHPLIEEPILYPMISSNNNSLMKIKIKNIKNLDN